MGARLERPLTERETEAMLPLLPRSGRSGCCGSSSRKSGGSPVRLSHSTPCLVGAVPLAGASAYPAHLSGQALLPGFPRGPLQSEPHHRRGAGGPVREPVGVDIEHIRPVSERAMRRLADVTTERAFFQSWVRREARASAAAPAWGPCWRRRPAPAWGAILFSGHLPGYVAGVATRDGAARPGAQIPLDDMMG
ncbi:MAG: hypothetical protein ACLTYN_01000 [Dysosmobacter welbionis]